jgi:hypothetical protein
MNTRPLSTALGAYNATFSLVPEFVKQQSDLGESLAQGRKGLLTVMS